MVSYVRQQGQKVYPLYNLQIYKLLSIDANDVAKKISLISINPIRLFSLAKHTTLALIVSSQPSPSLHVYPHGMPAYTNGERPVCTDIGTAA